MNTSGFYNADALLRAGKFVLGPNFSLLSEQHNDYTYPMNGWYWFDSAEEAATFFDIPLEMWNLDLPLEE
jgi:hypothetical protein